MLDRRNVLRLASLTPAAALLQGTAFSASAGISPMTPDQTTPQKAMAAEQLRGLLNLFLPSFMADGITLDEVAIRHDVQHSIAQGFAGTLPLPNWTPPDDPRWKQFHEIIVDEAAGKLPLHGIITSSDPETDIAQLKRFEALGAEMILLAPRHDPNISEADLTEAMLKRVRATDMSFILYAALNKGRSFPHLGPAGQPLGVYDRLADEPNVVAAKISQPVTLTSTMQMCEVLADRLLMAPVNLDFFPLLARHYHMQWSGQWNAEAVQTPDSQIGNELMAACAAKDFQRVDQIMLKMQPVIDHFYLVQANSIRMGGHPWQHNKYYTWLGGGNGGLLPVDPHSAAASIPVLTASARAGIRAAFKASNLTPTDAPEEQFIVGRAAWARGVRPADLQELTRYEV
ncbi:MAG: dihydrodipicolinate synthase [Ponticaulis sp.]|nr:dihydrodipicolinate synthase [Ponticaulis sp.]|tara:strand:+ start:39650 stop:40849 length:1200 start_codon:yes stop_codon:yes gene_type:complete